MPDADHIPKEEIERFNDQLSRLGMHVANLPGNQLAAALKMLPTKANGSMAADDFKKASAQLSGARALLMTRNIWQWVACTCFTVIAMQMGILLATAYFMSGADNQPTQGAVIQNTNIPAQATEADAGTSKEKSDTDRQMDELLLKLQNEQQKKAEKKIGK